jgi:hypothetical protein
MIANTIDLSPASARSAPASVRDWAVAAAASWAVPIDNLSTIPPWLSDALCRAVTGDGLVSRELYTDDGLSILAFRRCIILTSIDPGALRGDLADRLMPIELQRIRNYRDDAGIVRDFRSAHARILGGLLHLTAQVLSRLPEVETARLPRMADFARVLVAVDELAQSNSFKSYLGLTGRVMQMAFEDDPVAQAVAELMDRRREWSGTAAELLESIKPDGSPKTWPEDWPRTARGLAGRLRRAIPVLRNVTSIDVSFSREGHQRARTITLRYDSDPKTPSAQSAPSDDGSEQGERADGHADGELPMRTVEGFADGREPSSSEVPSARANGSEQVIHSSADGADDADGIPGPLSSQLFDELGWEDRYPDEFATESEDL